MAYQYKGKQTYAQELAAAQAEADQLKAEADETARQLREIKAARRKAEEHALRKRQMDEAIFELTTGHKRLPPPIHGGRKGLEAAADEAHGWWKRKQLAKRQAA